MIGINVCSAAFLLAASALAQTFEVASIRPSAPQDGNRRIVRAGGDPGRINYQGVTLKFLLARAYDVKDFQVTGPDWLNTERYDVIAKLPECADRDQVPRMLQALIADRFKLTLHREQKDLPVYDLVVAKGGPKLKPSEGLKPEMLPEGIPKSMVSKDVPVADGNAPEPPRNSACPPPPPEKAAARPAPRPSAMMIRIGDGHLEMNNTTLPGLANYLTNVLGRPVLDKTELQGNYDVQLDVDPTELMANMRRSIGAPAIGHAGGEPPRPEAPLAPESTGGSVFTAVQQLGLKLEGRKAPLEMIVVDHADKVPTEN